jgi:hypothetical protein
MSNLTDLLPAGAGGKQVDFVASGTIGNGVTVGLNSDGTVTIVGISSQELGSSQVFESATVQNVRSTFDSNSNKIVVAYKDDGNSSYGTAVVGTVSGTSISFGTPVVFENAQAEVWSVQFESSSNKIVIVYADAGNSYYGTAIVGTVSGTSISFGSPVVYESVQNYYGSATIDSTNNKVVIVYSNNSNSDGTAIIGTVSGTSISFGTPVDFLNSSITDSSVTFDSVTNQVVIAYIASNLGYSVVGAVSGTSISFGSAVLFNSSNQTNQPSIVFDDASNKIIISFRNVSNGYGTATVGTVSGTSISFGTPVVFESANIQRVSSVFDTNSNQVITAYVDGGNTDKGTLVVGAVSGTSISFGTPVIFANSITDHVFATFDSTSNQIVLSYKNTSNSGYGTSVIFKPEASNFSNFIGISDAAISDTASGSVTIKGGISTKVTGLTPNSTYYVQEDGSLSTTVSSVLAGKALSSTSINLDYTT